MVYVGLDVHRKRTQVALLDEDGNEVLNRSIANRAEDLTPVLGKLDPGTEVAFEAAYGWGWLAELLDELSLDAHLVHPSRCKAIASARLKNDKVDARTIAQLLRADILPEAWIAPKKVRDLRLLLRTRARLVRTQTAFKNRIHAVLADAGIVTRPESLWTGTGRAWLEDLELAPTSRRIVDDCLTVIDSLLPVIEAQQRDIKAQARPDQRVEALTKLHGVGHMTAMMIVAEVGDVTRFASPRKLCAWAGLTPNVRNSADKVRHGHISKQGSPWLRWALVEAAHKAKTRPPFERAFSSISARRGKNIATVAIARKLLTRCYFILKETS